MTVYDFSLASWYEPSGVDTAMCYRANIYKNMGYDVKMIFPTPPYRRDFLMYTGMGLDHDVMLGVHSSFSDLTSFAPVADLYETIQALKETLNCSQTDWGNDSIIFVRNNTSIAKILLTEDKEHFYCIEHYHNTSLYRRDYYSDRLYASWFYETAYSNGLSYAQLRHRTFYNSDGSIALMQTVDGEEELNIFPDGSTYNREELFQLFVQRLNPTKEDFIFIDRSSLLFTMKPLLAMHDQTNIITIIHSDHYFKKGYSIEGYYLNREYWYWFKYSKYIHSMIVSTEPQKQHLKQVLESYRHPVPDISVIPAICIDAVKYPTEKRRRKAVACMARLNERKKLDWTIHAIIKAHSIDSEITLDIYGKGEKKYLDYLQRIIDQNNASSYIHLKGFTDVTELYKEYELFLTTSLWETFGITLLEAAASGLPIVGLDVDYGNKIFIQDGQNGYSIPYDPEHFKQENPAETDVLAEKVVDILSDEAKLKAFSEESYRIASQFLSDKIRDKWKTLLENF